MAEFGNLPGGNETILIVDDHETIWDFLIEALQELGYSVLLAENGLALQPQAMNRSQVAVVLYQVKCMAPSAPGMQVFA